MVLVEEPDYKKEAHSIRSGLKQHNYLIVKSIFFFVPEKVVLGRVVGPDVFDALVDLVVVLELLEVLDDLFGRAGAVGIVYQFVFGCRPRSVVQAAGKF